MKSIRIILFILCGLIGSTVAVRAQDEAQNPGLERIRAAQIAYLSKELDLSPEEAQKFWPVYNQYSKEVETLIAERKRTMKDLRQNPDPADPTAQATQDLKYQQRMLDIKTRYKDQFVKVLPAQKVNTLYRAERDFRQALLREYKMRQEQRGVPLRRMRQ